MSTKKFILCDDSGGNIEAIVDNISDVQLLKGSLASSFGVVVPEEAAEGDIAVKVDRHSVREVPGPQGLPFVGNYFEVFPDHLGNNQRLFEKHGPIVKTNNMGNVVFETNDPDLAQICFTESEWWSKEIVPSHPLHPIKNSMAGVFLSDSADPSWKIVHKFLPPALGPKAVRHYAPTMNKCCDEAYPVLDELEKRNDAWNVYQMMLKISSSTVGKIMLGKDFQHFSSVDAPLNRIVLAIAEMLAVNKRIQSHGEWYSHLPFGDPVRLKHLRAFMRTQIEEAIKESKSSDTEDLPLQDAALKASSVIDYLSRATDSAGKHMPTEYLESAVEVATGAGFTTTSSLLSWCIYGLVTYEGMQARLLQELVDHNINDTVSITADQIDDLHELNKYVKEMQRRHNPSYQPARTAQRDQILPGGYRIKKGDVVVVGVHHIHMNPTVWDNPNRFDPDRWDTDEVKNRHKVAYAPFAFGQRMCIGFNFALLEVKIFLCKLVWRYHWAKEGDLETEYDPFFQLIRPVNFYGSITARTSTVGYTRYLERRIADLEALLGQTQANKEEVQATGELDHITSSQSLDLLVNLSDDYLRHVPGSSCSGFYGRFSGLNVLRVVVDCINTEESPATLSHPGQDILQAFECAHTSVPLAPATQLHPLAAMPSRERVLVLVDHAIRMALVGHDCLDHQDLAQRLGCVFDIDRRELTSDDRVSLALVYALLALGQQFEYTNNEQVTGERMEMRGTNIVQTKYLLSASMIPQAYTRLQMGVAMSQTMGLHASSSSSRGLFTEDELNQRRAVFATMNMMDTYVSSVLGVPKALETSTTQILGPDDDQILARHSLIFRPPASVRAESKSFQELVAFMARISMQRNPKSADGSPLQEDGSFVARISVEMDEWHNTLPTVLYNEPDSRTLLAQLSIRLLHAATRSVLYRPYLNHLTRDSTDHSFSFQGYEFGSRCITAAMQAVWIIDTLKSNNILYYAHWVATYMLAYAFSILAFFLKRTNHHVTFEENLAAAVKARELLKYLAEHNPTAQTCYLVVNAVVDRLPVATD
ncbi:putative Cytochrome P450 monooxygenase [Seiridium unicorne]|uniref:Cytochrome P450 monooxygenase n=1 Tax=Seiridium unicorne TaxID=138068 RepID=A0ABR2VF11_9PEZI